LKKTCAILALSLPGSAALAAPPTLDGIWPPGGQKGTEIEATLSGKFDPWPCQLHFSEKGFTFTPDPEKAGTGKLKIAKEIPVGGVLVRAGNQEGITAPVFFVVDDRKEVLEEEKDDSRVGKAQVIDTATLPLVVNGKLAASHELDSYRLTLKKGETIHAAVEAYTLRSLVDPALHVYDPAGNRIALEHDGPVHLDPSLAFTAPADGDYIVSVAGFAHPPAVSVYFRGDKKTQYRLHLARKRESLPKRLFPSDPGPDTDPKALAVAKPGIGTLLEPAEIDRFSLTAKKGQKILVRVDAASLGFPTDPVLRILKPDGAELRLVDDANKESDPEYLWTVSADGDYGIEVSERFRRGGPEMRYKLDLVEPKPDFTATIEKSEYLLEPGKTVEIKVKIGRLHGHKENLKFALPGLPDSITLTPPEKVPEKGGDVALKLEAKADAVPFQQALSLGVSDIPPQPDEGEPRNAVEKTAVVLFRDDNSRGPYLFEEASGFWLTIPPKKEEKAGEEKK
jgi:hypothetical protein